MAELIYKQMCARTLDLGQPRCLAARTYGNTHMWLFPPIHRSPRTMSTHSTDDLDFYDAEEELESQMGRLSLRELGDPAAEVPTLPAGKG